MIKKIMNKIKLILGRSTIEDLNIKACIEKGMKVGQNCHGLGAATIDYAHCWLIEIGDNVTFAPQVYLLAHDASTKKYLDYTKVAKIKIEDNVFVGARALIMPGVHIGKNSIIGAGSVVTKSVLEGSVVAGNPAKFIMTTDEYIKKNKELIKNSKIYDWSYTIGGGITEEKINKMSIELNNDLGYVK